MNDKAKLMAELSDLFVRWQDLLASLTEEEVSAPLESSAWSIKDVIAHLWAWQQLSIARLEAALLQREPQFSMWPAELDPESEDHLEAINDWIYHANRDRSWSAVHRNWQEGFQRFLWLAQAIPEQDLMDPERYPWLDGYPLQAVLVGSYEHHLDDHLEPLIASGV
jgi:hypothetical protein